MDKSELVVSTHSGQVKGTVQRSCEGFFYCAFKGIPYAEPPTGELRFKDPVPVRPWTGIKDADEYGQMCMQVDYFLPIPQIMGSEDCLYLNVFVKSTKNNKKLPVMVYFFCGIFIHGSGDDMQSGPDYLLRKDIVLVTFNYRLGILGFLNLEDEVAPGNQGLKDQILALKWVQKNIENFGGDPNNVTVFGSSSGAASILYLSLSSLSKGLFHRAILSSPASCSTWACTSSKKNALRVCRTLGNDSFDSKELVKFLRSVDCVSLIKEQNNRTEKEKIMSYFLFTPGIDSTSEEPVMPIHPAEAMKSGAHVPLIVGYTTREGLSILTGLERNHFRLLDQNMERYLHDDFKKILSDGGTTIKGLKKFYFGDKRIRPENLSGLVNLQSDILFVRDIHRLLKYQAKQHKSQPTYFYYFTYDDTSHSYIKKWTNTSLPGAAHIDELGYLFKMRLHEIYKIENLTVGSCSYRFMEQLTEMWTNFATYGNPTPETSDLIPVRWLPMTNNDKVFQALNIGSELKIENITSLEVLTSNSSPSR